MEKAMQRWLVAFAVEVVSSHCCRLSLGKLYSDCAISESMEQTVFCQVICQSNRFKCLSEKNGGEKKTEDTRSKKQNWLFRILRITVIYLCPNH